MKQRILATIAAIVAALPVASCNESSIHTIISSPGASDSVAQTVMGIAKTKLLTKCIERDNSLYVFDSRLIQAKRAEYKVEPLRLTESDKLNGQEWVGAVVISLGPTRVFNKDTAQWSGWNDDRITRTIYVTKQNGKWHTKSDDLSNLRIPTKEELSAMTKQP